MIKAFELAGAFAAHAIGSIAEGDALIPMLAYTNEDDERQMERLVFEGSGAAVEYGQQRLSSNAMDANDAALLYDGQIVDDGKKTDALIIELRTYFSPRSVATIAIPYTPKGDGPFQIHKPCVMVWEHCEDFDLDHAFGWFFDGVESHEEGSKVWRASFDGS